MSKVLRFLTREEQRIKRCVETLDLPALRGMNQMLPGGFTFKYYRFGPPTLVITEEHHWLIQEELSKRNDSQDSQVPRT